MVSAMKIKIQKVNPEAFVPTYGHPGDAGLDLYSTETTTIRTGERHFFDTGVALEIPKNYVGLIWEKSGLACRDGLISLGGVIDSTYRGPIDVVLWNLSKKSVKIKKGDKIAQLLIQPVLDVKINVVKKLSQTARGGGRYGSTGRN